MFFRRFGRLENLTKRDTVATYLLIKGALPKNLLQMGENIYKKW